MRNRSRFRPRKDGGSAESEAGRPSLLLVASYVVLVPFIIVVVSVKEKIANSLITCTSAEDDTKSRKVGQKRRFRTVRVNAMEKCGRNLPLPEEGNCSSATMRMRLAVEGCLLIALKSCAKKLSAGMLFSRGRGDVGRTSIHSFVALSLTTSCTAQKSLKASKTTFSSNRPRDMAVGLSQLLVSSYLLGQKTEGGTFQRKILELHYAQLVGQAIHRLGADRLGPYVR